MFVVLDPSSNNVPSAVESDTDIPVRWMMPSNSGIAEDTQGRYSDPDSEGETNDVAPLG